MVHGLIKISDQAEGKDKDGDKNFLTPKNKKTIKLNSDANIKTPALININCRVGLA
jgi:hypothetical protein